MAKTTKQAQPASAPDVNHNKLQAKARRRRWIEAIRSGGMSLLFEKKVTPSGKKAA